MAIDVHASLAAKPDPGAPAQAFEPAPEDMGTVPPAPIAAGPAAEDAPIDGLGQLTVTDALSYLDAIKVQFADQPDVYERFLAVMKDFRNQLYVESSLLRGGYAYELAG
jgi:paired amphipathic helix protein Sin3a